VVDNHWVRYDTEEPFVPNLDKFGFVYLITKIQNGKAYVGCKQYYVGRTKKQHKWETYIGSSKYLSVDIEKDGKEKFKFEVIAEYKNKRSLHYYEAYYQMKWNVLTATLKDSDEQAFYNSYVGGKWYRPVESYQDPEYKRKMSEVHKGKIVSEEAKKKIGKANSGKKHGMYQGKAEFYLDGKLIKVDCLTKWCGENGYNKGNITRIAQTNRDGFSVDNRTKSGKIRAFSCNGPLGTITKVKWIGKEENDVNKKSNVRHSTS